MDREPTIQEIAKELDLSKKRWYAMDAIQDPISLYEPIYHDGGDPLLVMDQIGDEKNNDSLWLEHVAISEAMKRLRPRERKLSTSGFFSRTHKWRSHRKLEYLRLKSQDWKKQHCKICGNILKGENTFRKNHNSCRIMPFCSGDALFDKRKQRWQKTLH